MPPALFPVFLIVHIVLAIGLFVPSLLLPFAFRARRGSIPGGTAAGVVANGVVATGATAPAESGRFVRIMLALQARGTLWIGGGLALTGIGLVASLGVKVVAQPWLLVALAIYALNLVIAYFIQAPRLRRLIGLRSGSDPRWPDLARRQRYLSYVMAGLVGTIGFLMTAKPALW